MENEKKRQIETFPENYNNLLANIMFYRQHPVVNEVLLDYAISQTLIKRTDTSLHVTSPLEVEKGFLFNMISYYYILYIPSLSWFDHRLATSSLRRMRQLRGGKDYDLRIRKGSYYLHNEHFREAFNYANKRWIYFKENV